MVLKAIKGYSIPYVEKPPSVLFTTGKKIFNKNFKGYVSGGRLLYRLAGGGKFPSQNRVSVSVVFNSKTGRKDEADLQSSSSQWLPKSQKLLVGEPKQGADIFAAR